MTLLPDREGLALAETQEDDPLVNRLRRIAGRAMSAEEWRLQTLSYVRSGLRNGALSLDDVDRLLTGSRGGLAEGHDHS